MEELCENDYVGYCTTQSHRIDGFNEAKKVNFDLSKIKTKCELDCSQSVRVCVHAAGIECEDFRTEKELEVLKATGEFEILTSDKYCKSSDYLKRGDIEITCTKGHTIIILSNGSKASSYSTNKSSYNKTVKWNGYVNATSLNVRTGAGTKYSKCSFSPLKKDVEVSVCDSAKASDGSTWYYIKYNGKYGFVHSSYISKFIKYKTTSNLNLRSEAGVIDKKNILCVIPKGKTVEYKNKYKTVNGVKWYYVAYDKKTGYVSSKYLSKV